MISLRSKITKAVLGYFFLHEQAEEYINELARKLSLDSGNLTRKLKELEDVGILVSSARGKETYFSLNKSFPLLKEYKKIILKTVGFEHSLRGVLSDIKGIQEAYIYGSYAKNQMDAHSDIDVMIVGEHDALILQKKISALQKMTDREINITQMSREESQRRKNTDAFYKGILKQAKIKII